MDESDVKTEMHESFEQNSVTLSSQIEVIALAFDEKSPEQIALFLARDIIEKEEGQNVKILLEDDLGT